MPHVAAFLNDSDAYVAREAASAINDAPIEAAFPALAAKLDSAPVADEAFVERAINANYRLGTPANAQALAQYATRTAASEGMRAEALLQLGLWGKTPQRDRVVGIYRPLTARDGKPAADALAAVLPKVLGKGPEAVQLAALEAIGNLQLRESVPTLVATVADNQAPEAVRVGALKALDVFGGDDVMRGIDAAEKSSASALRLAALQIVARRAPERALPIVRRLSTEGSEAEQQAAFQAMGQLKTAETPKLLVAALDQLAAGKVQPGAQLELIESAEASDAPAVKARWAKQQAAWAASGNPLAPYSFALAGGVPSAAGASSSRTRCCPARAATRWVAKAARRAPTSRSSVRRRRRNTCSSPSSSRARTSPPASTWSRCSSRTAPPRPAPWPARLPREIVLKRADGTTTTVDPKQVKERVTAPSSMPEIYAQVLTRSQLRDMVALLSVLTVPNGRR